MFKNLWPLAVKTEPGRTDERHGMLQASREH